MTVRSIRENNRAQRIAPCGTFGTNERKRPFKAYKNIPEPQTNTGREMWTTYQWSRIVFVVRVCRLRLPFTVSSFRGPGPTFFTARLHSNPNLSRYGLFKVNDNLFLFKKKKTTDSLEPIIVLAISPNTSPNTLPYLRVRDHLSTITSHTDREHRVFIIVRRFSLLLFLPRRFVDPEHG